MPVVKLAGTRPFSILVTLLAVSVIQHAAASPLSYRAYSSGQSLWIQHRPDLFLYRYDTKSLKQIVLHDSVETDSIHDVAEDGATLWVSAASGLYQIDRQTATIEKTPGRPPLSGMSCVTADMDFAWTSTGAALWKFDKLSREWFAFQLEKNAPADGRIVGAASNGSEVILITTKTVLRFSIMDEKWSSFPHGFNFSQAAEFFPGAATLTTVDQNRIFRYIIDKRSWDVVTVPSAVTDITVTDDRLHILTKDGIYQYTGTTSVLQRFDIPDASAATALSLLNDTTIALAGRTSMIHYSTQSRSTENIPYAQQVAGQAAEKIISGSIAIYPSSIGLYSGATRTWEVYPLALKETGVRKLNWDDDGLRLRYAPAAESRLRGNITQRFSLLDGGYVEKIDSTMDSAGVWKYSIVPGSEKQFYYSPSRAGSDLYADLTLHTTLPGNRYVDLFFTKAASTPTKKGLFYRGDGDDRFESARAGTNTLTPTQTIPSVQYDGASAIVHSRSSLESRDRKIIRAQGGGGLVTSKSMHTVLTYNRTGQYTIGGFDSTEHLIISPGSLRINVDGEDIDTLQYSFVPLTGSVIFKRRDLLDPTSVIIASYTVQTMPDSGLETVELVPKNNFGGIAFGSTTVSPTDWVSIQGGVTSLNTDSLARRRDIGTIVVPVELRLPHPDFLLKLTPELSIQGDNGSTAAALGLQSRLGAWQLGSATSFLLNTVMLDDSFSTTDTLSRGYGKLRSDLNFTVKHDIITELPITYSQADRKSLSGSESFRQASAGVHFRDLPFLDLIWSQNRLSAEQITDGTMADTLKLERNKSKINMRLYELSSPVLQDLLHMNRTGYEFSYTRLTSNKEPDVNPDSTGKQPAMPGTGDILFVSTTLSPISPVTVTGQTTFKQNKQQDWAFDSLAGLPVLTDRRSAEMNPSLTVQTIDAPQGIDLNAYFQSDYRSAADSGLVDIQRSFFIITKPGRWLGTLSWMSPRFGLSEKLTSVFNSRLPGPAGILFGSGGNVSNNLTRTVGLHLYPTGEILVRQENNYTTGDSIQNYYMFNDVKCWFGANRLWQTRYEYNAIDQGADLRVRRHKAFTFYDVTWNSWFRTNEKFSTDYTRKDSVFTDTAAVKRTASLKDLSFGPELSVSFNVQQRGSVKTLVNGHTAKIAWRQQNGRFIPGTEFSYTTFMELIVKPNISIETNNSFSWQQGSATYNGDLTASLLF